jgi:hypothetical protein
MTPFAISSNLTVGITANSRTKWVTLNVECSTWTWKGSMMLSFMWSQLYGTTSGPSGSPCEPMLLSKAR